jgi:hypothetical protein
MGRAKGEAMRRVATAALVVAAIGMLLASMLVPAGAHHSNSVRKLKKRVARLERSLNSFAGQTITRVERLQRQAEFLDPATGFYHGPVDQTQVISVEACLHGDDAVWADIPDLPGVTFLACSEGPYASAEALRELHASAELQKALKTLKASTP